MVYVVLQVFQTNMADNNTLNKNICVQTFFYPSFAEQIGIFSAKKKRAFLKAFVIHYLYFIHILIMKVS